MLALARGEDFRRVEPSREAKSSSEERTYAVDIRSLDMVDREFLARAEGAIEGLIVDEPRGENGFGYDPHFLLPDLGKTTAELAPEHKNRISHRGQALRSILDSLGDIFAP